MANNKSIALKPIALKKFNGKWPHNNISQIYIGNMLSYYKRTLPMILVTKDSCPENNMKEKLITSPDVDILFLPMNYGKL